MQATMSKPSKSKTGKAKSIKPTEATPKPASKPAPVRRPVKAAAPTTVLPPAPPKPAVVRWSLPPQPTDASGHKLKTPSQTVDILKSADPVVHLAAADNRTLPEPFRQWHRDAAAALRAAQTATADAHAVALGWLATTRRRHALRIVADYLRTAAAGWLTDGQSFALKATDADRDGVMALGKMAAAGTLLGLRAGETLPPAADLSPSCELFYAVKPIATVGPLKPVGRVTDGYEDTSYTLLDDTAGRLAVATVAAGLLTGRGAVRFSRTLSPDLVAGLDKDGHTVGYLLALPLAPTDLA